MELRLLFGLLEVVLYEKWWGFCYKDQYCFTTVDGFEVLS